MPTPILKRLFAATALALASSGALAYSNVFIFGDSLSDSGNNAIALNMALGTPPAGVPQAIPDNSYIPSAPYFPYATYSNGPVWASSFAAGLGLTAIPALVGGTNFAFGGARTAVDGTAFGNFPPSLATQVGGFLGITGGFAPGDALYVVAGGGNDARAALEVLSTLNPFTQLPQIISTVAQASAQYAIDVGNIVDTLQAAGAQNIVVWNTPDLGLTPAALAQGPQAAGFGTLVAANMNAALDYRLQSETGVLTFDTFGILNAVVANPAAYGLVDVTNACVHVNPFLGCATAGTNLFWDGIHPTAAGHALIAGAMLDLVAAPIPEPASMLLMAMGIVALLGVARRRAA